MPIILPVGGSSEGLEVDVNKKVVGYAQTTSGSYVTAHSYNGSGVLRSALQSYNSSRSDKSYLRITIDGIQLEEVVCSNEGYVAYGISFVELSNLNIRFNASILIEHKCSSRATTTWNYDID